MSLAAHVVAHLRSKGVPGAVIGGVAMAVHGIARATVDLDVLVAAPDVLSPSFWDALGPEVVARVRRGDASDPLAGVARCVSSDAVVDVVVGTARWMSDAIQRATPREVLGEQLPVVDAADLVLLKLYAGGPQDLLDVRMLFASDPALRAVVRTRVESTSASVTERLRDIGTG